MSSMCNFAWLGRLVINLIEAIMKSRYCIFWRGCKRKLLLLVALCTSSMVIMRP